MSSRKLLVRARPKSVIPPGPKLIRNETIHPLMTPAGRRGEFDEASKVSEAQIAFVLKQAAVTISTDLAKAGKSLAMKN